MQDPTEDPPKRPEGLNFGRNNLRGDASSEEIDKLVDLADMLRERAAEANDVAADNAEAVKQRIWEQISQHVESKTGKRV